MSRQYKSSADVPTGVLCLRLEELSEAVTKGATGDGEFTMRIPAECDRDADLVLQEASNRLNTLETQRDELQALSLADIKRMYDEASEDAAFDEDHPIFQMAKHVDELQARVEVLEARSHVVVNQLIVEFGDYGDGGFLLDADKQSNPLVKHYMTKANTDES